MELYDRFVSSMNTHQEHGLEQFLPAAGSLTRFVHIEVEHAQRVKLMVVSVTIVHEQLLVADSQNTNGRPAAAENHLVVQIMSASKIPNLTPD